MFDNLIFYAPRAAVYSRTPPVAAKRFILKLILVLHSVQFEESVSSGNYVCTNSTAPDSDSITFVEFGQPNIIAMRPKCS